MDHFVPWSGSPVNAVENLVVSDRRANRNKRNDLAAAENVQRWRERNQRLVGDLERIATAHRWESAPTQTLGVARALYVALHPAKPNLLWSAPRCVRSDRSRPPPVGSGRMKGRMLRCMMNRV